MYRTLAGMHKLLRHANGAQTRLMGQEKYEGTTRITGGRAKWTGVLKSTSARLATQAMETRQADICKQHVGPLPR